MSGVPVMVVRGALMRAVIYEGILSGVSVLLVMAVIAWGMQFLLAAA